MTMPTTNSAPTNTTTDGGVGGGADQQNVPIYEGRRALIIGLGSAGTRVCNQILERMNWVFRSPNNVPWVRFLCLETQNVPKEKFVRRHAQFEHLTITREQYSHLLANPQLYQQTLDFSSWFISDLADSADAIVDGANGIRQLGRLALLFPANFNKVMESTLAHLGKLRQLTIQQATQQFSSGVGQTVQVHLPNTLHVYVVGSLCGGTASGSFIDLGYILNQIPGYQLETTGIFLLPSPQESDDRKYGNAITSLIELNHFSSDQTRYQATFPNRPGQTYTSPTPGERPYRYLYLGQTRGTGPEEYPRLLTATSDYIFSDLVGGSATTRDGRRADVSEFFVQRDTLGATQKFFSFGLAAIEFPYTKVMKGCTARLSRCGFQEMLGEPLTESDTKRLIAQTPLLGRLPLAERLLIRGQDPLRSAFETAIDSIRFAAEASDAPIAILLEQLDAAFEGKTPDPLPSLPVGIVATTIADNARNLRIVLLNEIKEIVTQSLVGDNPSGIRAAIAYLRAVVTQLAAPKSGSSMSLKELKESMSSAYANVAICRSDTFVHLTFSTKQAVARCVDEFIEAAHEYYRERLRQQALPETDVIRHETTETIERWLDRLGNERVGLERTVSALIDEFSNLYRRIDVEGNTDEWSRAVNGTELFTAGQTISMEYAACIDRAADLRRLPGDRVAVEKIVAKESVRSWFRAALEDLFLPTTRRGSFDNGDDRMLRPNSDDALLVIAEAATDNFTSLRQRTVVDRILERPERDSLFEDLKKKGNLFLDCDPGHPRHVHHERKSYGFIFYNSQDRRATEFRTMLDNIDFFEGTGGLKSYSEIADIHQLMVLQERGAFSLGIVKQLDESATNWWSTYHHPQGGKTRHSRGDVAEWVNWTRQDEKDRNDLRTLFLTGVATNVLEFRSATQYVFRYEKLTPVDSGEEVLSNDINEAVLRLRRSGREGQLGQQIKKFRQEWKPEEMVRRLATMAESSDGKFTEFGRQLSAKDVQDYLLDFIFDDRELNQVYQQFYPNPVELSYRKPDKNGELVYFCPHCNKILGHDVQSLNIMENVNGRMTRVRKCAYCKKSIP